MDRSDSPQLLSLSLSLSLSLCLAALRSLCDRDAAYLDVNTVTMKMVETRDSKGCIHLI